MLQSLRNLIGHRLELDDRTAVFRDAFFNLKDGVLRYAALDIGGWLNEDNVAVSTELLTPPDPTQSDARWHVHLSEAALEIAPRWTEEARTEGVNLSNWPPVIVGPFGSSVSPVLFYEDFQDAEEEDAESEPETQAPPKAAPLVRNLHRVGKWFGLPCFDAKGELGRIHDMTFDPDSCRILSFVLEGAGARPDQGREIPYQALRHLADGETHLIFETLPPADLPDGR